MKVFYCSAPFEMTFAHFDVQHMPPTAADRLGVTWLCSSWLILALSGAGLLWSCFRPLSDLIPGLTGSVPARAI